MERPAATRERIEVAGDREKLGFMRANANRAAVAPSIVELASNIVRPYRPDDWAAQATALHRFVRDGIRYQRDPNRREQLADPRVALGRGYGDCDDKVAAFVALAQALGMEADFWPVWKPGTEATPDPVLDHVQGAVRWPGSSRRADATSGVETLDAPIGSGWVISDQTIAGAELGQDPRGIARNPETGKLPLS